MNDLYKKVSVIAINFHSVRHTVAMLKSLQRDCYPNLEVIVVDNESKFDPTIVFRTILPKVKVIRSEKNLGFAGANNLAIQVATGDFLFFLNNDAEVTNQCILRLTQRLLVSEHIGAVSPKIKYFNSNIIQYAGFTPINPLTGRNLTIGKGEIDKGQHDTSQETAYVHGAAMMVRSEVVHKIGKMPEDYFIYYEELDWSTQISKEYMIYYEPNALVYHKESRSVGENSPLKTYYQTRNRILFMYRSFSVSNFSLFLLFFLVFSLPKTTLTKLVKNEYQNIKALFKGSYDALIALLSNEKYYPPYEFS
ncbi:glycosyltransferase family 2 protein [Flammeovirgaceae bacterium SG7u.111]|nr:glycosyltransferase family 2 protein [Flammeovirgaceae bacterium SG7u.132]WPO34565.1 glycosyltransferase family 2 protein [Flammeovirgaceae bacterium SG7u.111]